MYIRSDMPNLIVNSKILFRSQSTYILDHKHSISVVPQRKDTIAPLNGGKARNPVKLITDSGFFTTSIQRKHRLFCIKFTPTTQYLQEKGEELTPLTSRSSKTCKAKSSNPFPISHQTSLGKILPTISRVAGTISPHC